MAFSAPTTTDRLFDSLDGDDPSPTNKSTPKLPLLDEAPTPKPSLHLINFNTFIMNVEYSCLMPTVYDYTISLNGDAKFFGYVLATFSLVRMCVFIPIGWWADKRSFREVYCCTAAVGFIGCFIYGAAGALGSKWWLLIGRALTGLGASNTTLSRTYVSKCVEADEFTRILGVQMSLNLLGVMVGPALIAGIRKVDVDYGWFHLNEQTAPGYIMAVLQAFMLFNFVFTFNEPPPARFRKSIRRKSLQVGMDEAQQAKEAGSWTATKRVLLNGGGWFFVLTVFTINFNLTALETVATPLMEKYFGWGALENSTFFAGCAVAGVAGMVTGMKLAEKANGTKPMAVGFVCMTAAFGVWFGWDSGQALPMAPFLIGSALCVFGLCVLTPANSSYFTKIVEWQGGAQGVFGGLWSVFMSFGKAMGPLVAGFALNELDKGEDNRIVFLLCAPVLAVNVVFFPYVFKYTRQLDERVGEMQGEKEEGGEGGEQSLLDDYAGMEEGEGEKARGEGLNDDGRHE